MFPVWKCTVHDLITYIISPLPYIFINAAMFDVLLVYDASAHLFLYCCCVRICVGVTRELGRSWRLPKSHAKYSAHLSVEKLLKGHVDTIMVAVESAHATSHASAKAGEALSLLEWVGILRLLGVNLGEHFHVYMRNRV